MRQRETRFPGTVGSASPGVPRERESRGVAREKVLTMPTQKVFKRRVRTRMAKTGESYTSARQQLLRKANPPAGPREAAQAPAGAAPGGSAARTSPHAANDLLVSDEAMVRATGQGHDAWFALLDAWGATQRSHTEIARWVHATHGVPGWWSQNITVAYERVRGMRRPGQMADGFTVVVSRTIAAEPDRLLAAFTDPAARARWLPDAPLRSRPTRAARTARFDWTEPPSRLTVTATPTSDGRAVLSVSHEKLPDAAVAEELRERWRTALDELRTLLVAGGPSVGTDR
jgi:uncharacterized protein YndB with AHSA1/START domain